MNLAPGAIPFVMTAKMKVALRALGKSDVEISNLTPAGAHVILEAEAKRKIEAIAVFRKRILAAGFDPIPVEGKKPSQREWQKIKATDADIATWPTIFPDASNTGSLDGAHAHSGHRHSR